VAGVLVYGYAKIIVGLAWPPHEANMSHLNFYIVSCLKIDFA